MASVVVKGEVTAGIIYDPMGNDWVIAERGAGAWLCKADGSQTKLAVAAPVGLGDMVGCASTTYAKMEDRVGLMTNLAKVRIAASYRNARMNIAPWRRLFPLPHVPELMPWDHLVGAIICEEAGAMSRASMAPSIARAMWTAACWWLSTSRAGTCCAAKSSPTDRRRSA